MPWKFNPFSVTLDQTGSGGGATVFDGEVQFFSNLPQTVGTPPVNSAYLVRESEGTVWFGNKKQKGIYVRSGNSGVRNDDWTYGGEYPVTSVNGATGAVVIPTYTSMGPGLVPNATGSDLGKFLRGDSTWTYPLVGEVTGLSDALAAKQNTGDYVTPTRVETDYFDRGSDNAASRPGTGGQKRYQVVLSNDTRLTNPREVAWITPAPTSPTDNTTNPVVGSVAYDGNYLYILVIAPGGQSKRWGRVPMPLNW